MNKGNRLQGDESHIEYRMPQQSEPCNLSGFK